MRLPLSLTQRAEFLIEAQKPGQCWIYPTETFYGLGALATDERAVQRIYQIKQRPEDQPLLVLVSGFLMLERFAILSAWERAWLEVRWPGPLTVLLQAKGLAPALNKKVPLLGFRWTAHKEIADLIEVTGVPWVGTSANLHGQPPWTLAQSLAEVDLVLDGGPCPGGQPSTLVDLSGGQVRVLRPGAMPVTDGEKLRG